MSALSLDDAKAYLRLPLDSSDDDAKLQGFIDSAESTLAKRVGPLEPTTVTRRISGGSALVLPVMPVISLTSITPINAAALTLSDYYLNTESGVVTHIWGGYFPSIAYDVVYQAGRTTLDDDLVLAIQVLVEHLWTPQRGVMVRGGGDTAPAPGYLLPNRVLELISPYQSLGFA